MGRIQTETCLYVENFLSWREYELRTEVELDLPAEFDGGKCAIDLATELSASLGLFFLLKLQVLSSLRCR